MLCFIVSLAVQCSFSRGAVISVGGSLQDAFGPVTVNIPASAPAQISIDASTAAEWRSLVVKAEDESMFSNLGFEVAPLPVANSGGPCDGNVRQIITFDGSKFTAPNGHPLQCIWDFGDNTTASGVTPAHAYSSGGTLTVSLTGTGMTRIYWGTDTANEVAEVNEIPQISSTPVITSQVGAAYGYQVLANDPAGDPLSYWLIGPKDMAISADGLITWAPLSPGFFQIIVNVTDGRGGKVSQTYTLTVTVPGD
jgi:PKD domain-containing protein/putative Ig domain-containing protein